MITHAQNISTQSCDTNRGTLCSFSKKISTGKHIAGFTQKKASAWQPQWTRDEALCYLRSPNNEIVVYKNGDFSVVDKRLSIAKLESFSASPGNNSGANKAYPG